jgi:putative heme iron utilization protein
MESDRIRAAVEKNPRKMTLQLARDLGVPEVEIIRAFPPDRVMELDIARSQILPQLWWPNPTRAGGVVC